MCTSLSPGLLRWSSLQTKEGQRHTEFHLVGFENSKTPSTTTVWPIDHREDWTIGLVLGPSTVLYIPFQKHCTHTNKAVGTIWRPCPNLFRGDKVLIFVPSDCYSGLLQPSDLSSLPDGRSIACPIRVSLYIFLLYNIYHLCFTCIDFNYLSAWDGCWFVVYIRRFIYKF